MLSKTKQNITYQGGNVAIVLIISTLSVLLAVVVGIGIRHYTQEKPIPTNNDLQQAEPITETVLDDMADQSLHLADPKYVFVLEDDGTIIESENRINLSNATKKFYADNPHRDAFDFISFFPTFIVPTPYYHTTIRSNVTGIGHNHINGAWVETYDVLGDGVGQFGNSKRLLGVNFINQSQVFTDPMFLGDEKLIDSNLFLITHETAHLWGIRVGDDVNCNTSGLEVFRCMYDDLKFRLLDGHYNRWANTGFVRDGELFTDVLGGFAWKDNGDGTFSQVYSHDRKSLSPLTLYLMGLMPVVEVPDFTFIKPENSNDLSTTIKGSLRRVTIQEFISQLGPRNPDYSSAPKDFNMAFVLITKRGVEPIESQIAALRYISEKYPQEWNFVTFGKSTLNSRR